jgi:hypothetical protein
VGPGVAAGPSLYHLTGPWCDAAHLSSSRSWLSRSWPLLLTRLYISMVIRAAPIQYHEKSGAHGHLNPLIRWMVENQVIRKPADAEHAKCGKLTIPSRYTHLGHRGEKAKSGLSSLHEAFGSGRTVEPDE